MAERDFGTTTRETLDSLFSEIPWQQERSRAGKLQRISPTLWLRATEQDASLGISVLGTSKRVDEPLEFLVAFEYTESYEKTHWFKQRQVDARINTDNEGFTLDEAEHLASLFAVGAYEELEEHFPPERRRVLSERFVD